MHLPAYQYSSEQGFHFFKFTSIGPRGRIEKVVEFQPTNFPDIYNLAFGDWDPQLERIDDSAITNNGDSLKVLATVASTVYAFTSKYPSASVFASGSTEVRNRLYRMGLTNNLMEISVDFRIYGLKQGQWESFVVGEDYEAFLAKRKVRLYGNQ